MEILLLCPPQRLKVGAVRRSPADRLMANANGQLAVDVSRFTNII